MGAVIKVFLLLVVGLVALLVLGVLFLKWKLTRALQALSEGLGEVTANAQPATIHLDAEGEPDWAEEERVAELVAALEAAGHQAISAYTVREIPGLTLQALVDEAESTWSVVYEHAAAGVLVDIVTRYADGGGLTVTNSPHVGNLDPMPGKERAIDTSADVPRLVEMWRDAVRADGRKPALAANFEAEFEQAYAEEMAWRDSRGGPTEEEVRRIAAQMGDDVSEDAIQAAVSLQGMQAQMREAERQAPRDDEDGDDE